jgi:hypothetical protein
VIDSIPSSWPYGNYPRILVAVGSSHGVVNQFAAERNTQELPIRYVSGPRNHFVIHKAGILDSGLFRGTAGELFIG